MDTAPDRDNLESYDSENSNKNDLLHMKKVIENARSESHSGILESGVGYTVSYPHKLLIDIIFINKIFMKMNF